MMKLVQSKSHFYRVTYAYILRVDLAKHTRAIKTQAIIYSSRLRFALAFLIPHSTTAISDPSFRVRVSRHHRRVSPGRIPCQSKHRGNLLLSDAALRRSSRP